MNVRPSILCPIDFSDASAGALRYAAAIAEHFVTRLIVLSVEDPWLMAATDLETAARWTRAGCEKELAAFVADAFGADEAATEMRATRTATLAMCELDLAAGKPAVEILRVARERSCDLIVMSSHGLTGPRKWFFGSTTERVLRDTTVPVLVTPPVNLGDVRIEDATGLIGCIVVPVDLSPASLHQTHVARGLAEALGVALVLVHVIEPVESRLLPRLHFTRLDTGRRVLAREQLDTLLATIPQRLRPEALIVSGDPAEETARVVGDRGAGLVVMGLHGSPGRGPRMGSVTYRMLCLSPRLVLALPPQCTAPAHRQAEAPATVFSETVSERRQNVISPPAGA